ncbi:MAG: CapA family protein [Muribaculaceae bacterium]|nr:CapA family protein [Muribaculaceae bacterium]
MLKIIGDINFSDGYFDRGIGIGSAIEQGGNPFKWLTRKSDDFWIGNFECVVSDSKSKKPFVISPSVLDNVEHMDFYSIANNHVMQHGKDGYNDLIDFLEKKNIPYAGSLNKKSNIIEHQNKKVGIICFSQRPDNFTKSPLYWHLPEYQEIEDEIMRLSSTNFKIAYIHWGYEFINYPNIDQKKLAHWLIDKGIDLVIGTHPHVAQGFEKYNDKYIFYSLGNAVFNMPWEPTKYGLMVNVDLSRDTPSVRASHIHIESDNFPMEIQNAPSELSFENLNDLLSIIEDNEKYFGKARNYYLQYRKENRKDILKKILKMSNSTRKNIIFDFIKRRF